MNKYILTMLLFICLAFAQIVTADEPEEETSTKIRLKAFAWSGQVQTEYSARYANMAINEMLFLKSYISLYSNWSTKTIAAPNPVGIEFFQKLGEDGGSLFIGLDYRTFKPSYEYSYISTLNYFPIFSREAKLSIKNADLSIGYQIPIAEGFKITPKFVARNFEYTMNTYTDTWEAKTIAGYLGLNFIYSLNETISVYLDYIQGTSFIPLSSGKMKGSRFTTDYYSTYISGIGTYRLSSTSSVSNAGGYKIEGSRYQLGTEINATENFHIHLGYYNETLINYYPDSTTSVFFSASETTGSNTVYYGFSNLSTNIALTSFLMNSQFKSKEKTEIKGIQLGFTYDINF
ncbi:MAG: hypothetical protein KDK90_20600 [Leptospiraceae bacterium]|nr:hypothetical protein [Leptospiraceae bacterium]